MSRNIAAGLLIVVFAFSAGVASAQKPWENAWEKPRAGWWKALRGGETATFEMTAAEMKMQIVFTVQKVEGSMITFASQTLFDGMTMPMTSEAIDAETMFVDTGHTAETRVQKGGKSTFRAGDASFDVTEYSVQSGDVKIQAWYAADLPPIFNGGNVRIHLSGDQPMKMTLVSYKKGR